MANDPAAELRTLGDVLRRSRAADPRVRLRFALGYQPIGAPFDPACWERPAEFLGWLDGGYQLAMAYPRRVYLLSSDEWARQCEEDLGLDINDDWPQQVQCATAWAAIYWHGPEEGRAEATFFVQWAQSAHRAATALRAIDGNAFRPLRDSGPSDPGNLIEWLAIVCQVVPELLDVRGASAGEFLPAIRGEAVSARIHPGWTTTDARDASLVAIERLTADHPDEAHVASVADPATHVLEVRLERHLRLKRKPIQAALVNFLASKNGGAATYDEIKNEVHNEHQTHDRTVMNNANRVNEEAMKANIPLRYTPAGGQVHRTVVVDANPMST